MLAGRQEQHLKGVLLEISKLFFLLPNAFEDRALAWQLSAFGYHHPLSRFAALSSYRFNGLHDLHPFLNSTEHNCRNHSVCLYGSFKER